MHKSLFALALAAGFSSSLAAQAAVSEVNSLTVPASQIDFDTMPAGPTTLGAINAAGTNGGATILGITLTPSSAARGVYNTSPGEGRALALEQGQLFLVDPPSGGFDAFNAQIDLSAPSTEFGLSIGDWVAQMDLDFYLGGTMVTTFRTSRYSNVAPNVKFFQMTGGAFDRIDIRASTTAGNWVIPELWIEQTSGYATFGQGCPGSNGTPALSSFGGSVPTIGTNFAIQVDNLPLSGGVCFVAFGSNTSIDPNLGSLPFDLGVIGGPGCNVLIDLITTGAAGINGGTAIFSLPIANDPALIGIRFYNQALVQDRAANLLGFTTSNAGVGTIE